MRQALETVLVSSGLPVAVCRGPAQLADRLLSHVGAALDRLFPLPGGGGGETAALLAANAGGAPGWEPACGAGWRPAGYAAQDVRLAAAYQEWCVAAGLPRAAAASGLLDGYVEGPGTRKRHPAHTPCVC